MGSCKIPVIPRRLDDVIIDVGGRDNEGPRAALTAADKVLIPVQPSSFDAALVNEARKINPRVVAVAVLNAAEAEGHNNAEAVEVLHEVEGVEVLPCVIIRRKAFRNAAAQGRSVLDMSPKDPKAADEVMALVKAVF